MSLFETTLTGRIPSKKNQKQIVRNRTTGRILILPSQNHKVWQEEQMWRLKNKKPSKPISKVERMEIVIYAQDRIKGDLTNKAESVMDLLVDAGILEDDNWFVVGDVRLAFGGIDKTQPRAEIRILYEESKQP